MKYIIHKSSRLAITPYQGEPTCQQAGVIPAKIYEIYEDALADAAKLSLINPIGFDVSKAE